MHFEFYSSTTTSDDVFGVFRGVGRLRRALRDGSSRSRSQHAAGQYSRYARTQRALVVCYPVSGVQSGQIANSFIILSTHGVLFLTISSEYEVWIIFIKCYLLDKFELYSPKCMEKHVRYVVPYTGSAYEARFFS